MPNWCENDEVIFGPEKDIRQFYKQFMSVIDKESVWLVDIFARLDFNYAPYYHRGYLTSEPFVSVTERGAAILFSSDTAWSPCKEVWEALLKEMAPSLKYFHFSVELGNSIAETNDTEHEFWDTDYIMDICEDNPDILPEQLRRLDGQTDWTAEELSSFLSDILDLDNVSLNDLIATFTEKYSSNENNIIIIEVQRS